jgi:hypothetical protein
MTKTPPRELHDYISEGHRFNFSRLLPDQAPYCWLAERRGWRR